MSGEHSSPHSKNISAHSQANTSTTIDEVDPYTVNDMKNNYAVPFDKFLLGLGAVEKDTTVWDKNDFFITGLLRDQPISLSIKEYGEKCKETTSYGPFSNHITPNLDNAMIVFGRNDPNCISELRRSPRQPLVVSLDKINVLVANDRWKELNTVGPTGMKWTWSDFRFISYSQYAKPNMFDPAMNSELGRGTEWSYKSETKVDPRGLFGCKGTRNHFLSDKVGALLGEGRYRQRALRKPCKPHNRVWHCLAYEYLIPLYKVTEISDFKQAVRDIVLGHHLLATSHTRILHRDISLHNLMMQVRNGVIRGVLNDWDFGGMEARTGTRPFMSIDLLETLQPHHLERFDWESFLYVICMIACRYDRGEDVNPDVLSDWYDTKDSLLQALKSFLLSYGKGLEDATNFYRQVVFDWIKPLRRVFSDGYRARYQHSRKKPSTPFASEVPFDDDDETLGGHVTWEKFWEILQF